MNNNLTESELIINKDGSIYHLGLKNGEIGSTVITVGDPDRVELISSRFDKVHIHRKKREFVTVTGEIGSKSISVISTGIGTDNIDIVLTELDAVVNVDFQNRTRNVKHKTLDIIRLGTSGTIQNYIELDSLLVSEYGLGMDGLMWFYGKEMTNKNSKLLTSINDHLGDSLPIPIYLSKGNTRLQKKIASDLRSGVTATALGFYGPQGRKIHGSNKAIDIVKILAGWNNNGQQITNLEMETAGIYGMADMLGHNALSISAILANRASGKFSLQPTKTVAKMVDKILGRLY